MALSPPRVRSRIGRPVRLPGKWADFEPSNREDLPAQLAEAFLSDPSPPPPPDYAPEVHAVIPEVYGTAPDVYGVYHEYLDEPQRQPSAPPAVDLPKDTTSVIDPTVYPNIRWMNKPLPDSAPLSPYGPFKAKTVYLLCEWFYNSSNTKSLDDLDALVDMMNTSGFQISDLKDFRARREMQRLDEYVSPVGIFSKEDGWTEGELELPLPKPGVQHNTEAEAPTFMVEGLYFRKIIEVIISEVQDKRFLNERHWLPHKTYWDPPAGPVPGLHHPPSPEHASDSPSSRESHPGEAPPPPGGPRVRIFSETYNSDAMNREYEKIRAQPRHPDDSPNTEYVVLPCALWSDATLLALFGSAKLWPIYLYIANISKYIRGMPTEFIAQHVAYVPEVSQSLSLYSFALHSLKLSQLPDELLDYYRQVYAASPTTETLRWLKSELMQRVWIKLLDDDFINAYLHGVVVECADGVVRRMFPRFFTYSADYPEKYVCAYRHRHILTSL